MSRPRRDEVSWADMERRFPGSTIAWDLAQHPVEEFVFVVIKLILRAETRACFRGEGCECLWWSGTAWIRYARRVDEWGRTIPDPEEHTQRGLDV